MEYELKYYYRVKYALVCAQQSFLKDPPKDEYEEYARKVIDEATFKTYRNLCGRIQRMLTSSCITIEKKIDNK